MTTFTATPTSLLPTPASLPSSIPHSTFVPPTTTVDAVGPFEGQPTTFLTLTRAPPVAAVADAMTTAFDPSSFASAYSSFIAPSSRKAARKKRKEKIVGIVLIVLFSPAPVAALYILYFGTIFLWSFLKWIWSSIEALWRTLRGFSRWIAGTSKKVGQRVWYGKRHAQVQRFVQQRQAARSGGNTYSWIPDPTSATDDVYTGSRPMVMLAPDDPLTMTAVRVVPDLPVADDPDKLPQEPAVAVVR